MNIFSLGNVYALKDEDGRYLIVTIENVKSRDIELTGYIYDDDKDKKIEGSPGPIDETAAQVKHTFKWDNDDLPNDAVTRNTIHSMSRIQKWSGRSIVLDRYLQVRITTK